MILGASGEVGALAQPIAPGNGSLFGPRGAATDTSGTGPLVVADTGHHRLMIWHQVPETDQAPADCLIGQPDFESEGRNGKGPAGAATLNVPTGVAISGNHLAVADAWNHRVLIWHEIPSRLNQPADLVLGQRDFASVEANRGGEAGADTLNWCYGVAFLGDWLVVSDTGNRRVLVWHNMPQQNGQPADLVLGQRSFTCRDESAGADAGPLGMRWPHSVAQIGSMILVSDAGNNRIMAWEDMPAEPGAPCNFVLGQQDLKSLEHNAGDYWPDAFSLNMPYSIAAVGGWLIAADTANSRLVGWDHDQLRQGGQATGLAGQHDFTQKGDNRWHFARRDSMCWPYGLAECGDALVIADSGNNRVVIWGFAP